MFFFFVLFSFGVHGLSDMLITNLKVLGRCDAMRPVNFMFQRLFCGMNKWSDAPFLVFLKASPFLGLKLGEYR
jgi:hypothetical protein